VAFSLPPTVDVDVLYRELFTPLFRYVYFRTGDYDVASDVTQTSFLKFLTQLGEVSDQVHAQKLLFVIARHTLIDYWRSAAVRRTVSRDDWEEVGSSEPTPEEYVRSQEESDFIRLILTDLSEVEADVVSLRLSGDIHYDTIAETLTLSPDNARQIYSRALRKIRAQLIEKKYFLS
jgi:RNA polymerase sigma-70 factor (ECF subfamily)